MTDKIFEELDHICHIAAMKLKSSLGGNRDFTAAVTFRNSFQDLSGQTPLWSITMPDIHRREILVKKPNYDELIEEYNGEKIEGGYHNHITLDLTVFGDSYSECFEEFKQKINNLPEDDSSYPDFNSGDIIESF